MKGSALPWLVFLSLWLEWGVVQADVFILTTGGRIEGELLNPDQSPRQTYQVKTTAGAVVTLAASQVERVLRASEAKQWYERWLPKMPNTAQGNWIMAGECLKRGLSEEREFHLREVLKHDPEHAPARGALGYSSVNDRWVKTDAWMDSHGYVRHRGAWRLRQEVELETAAEQLAAEENEGRKNLKMWRGWVLRGRGNEQQALEKIRSIKSPAAVPALVEVLEEPGEPTRLKLLYIEVLGGLHQSRATTAFVNRVLNEKDENVRDRCIDQLVAWDTEQAASLLIAVLQHKDNALVNRAASALARLKDPAAIPPLIEALSTKHRFQINTGSGTSASFSPDGGGGLSTGGGPKIIEVEKYNQDVRDALISLASGANYQYDKPAWRRWYAEKHSPKVVSLRRRD